MQLGHSSARIRIAEILFWMHAAIVLFWWGLFLVPSFWWKDKITFHFYLTVGIVIQQLLWGVFLMPWTRKFRMVCILTTPMQLLRGKNIADPNNYDYSFTKELLGKTRIHVPHRFATFLTFTLLTIVSIQYFFFR